MDPTSPALPVLPLIDAPAPSSGCGSAAPAAVRTLIDDFLELQATTTAVDRFATSAAGATGAAPTDRVRVYRDLLPASPPGPGQQYAFSVDLDACSGCKACVAACHSLNGLDEGESWRGVGLLVGAGASGQLQNVPTGCHHCADPGCLDGCPVDAYVKDDDGSVRHLDDQCIGCSYCTLTCSYEVPRYDRSRGIVRKCDMCHDRLAAGEAPACVQGCPTDAISITVVDLDVPAEAWPFPAPSPDVTRPTTRYVSSRDLGDDLVAVDRHTLAPRHAHPPLVVMLVLTQLAVGTFLGLELVRRLGLVAASSAAKGATAALVITAVALVASLVHLGRPQYAWRAVIGLRHSWLSREIVAFGAFAPLGVLHALTVAGWLPASVGALLPSSVTGAVASAAGIVAVATSVMVYVATGREGWRGRAVAARFTVTTLSLGALGTAFLTVDGVLGPDAGAVGWLRVGAAISVVALVADVLPLTRRSGDLSRSRDRRARLLRTVLVRTVQLRVAAGGLAIASALGASAVATRGAPVAAAGLAFAALALATVGELAARWWFFAAEASPRMPGSLA